MLITMGVGAFFIIINWKKWTKFDQSKSW
jgi:hypothetical protein